MSDQPQLPRCVCVLLMGVWVLSCLAFLSYLFFCLFS